MRVTVVVTDAMTTWEEGEGEVVVRASITNQIPFRHVTMSPLGSNSFQLKKCETFF